MEVFASHGYEGATTRVLARRARVTLPAIQYYFGSKEGLYRATVAYGRAYRDAHGADRRARAGGDRRQDIAAAQACGTPRRDARRLRRPGRGEGSLAMPPAVLRARRARNDGASRSAPRMRAAADRRSLRGTDRPPYWSAGQG